MTEIALEIGMGLRLTVRPGDRRLRLVRSAMSYPYEKERENERKMTSCVCYIDMGLFWYESSGALWANASFGAPFFFLCGWRPTIFLISTKMKGKGT